MDPQAQAKTPEDHRNDAVMWLKEIASGAGMATQTYCSNLLTAIQCWLTPGIVGAVVEIVDRRQTEREKLMAEGVHEQKQAMYRMGYSDGQRDILARVTKELAPIRAYVARELADDPHQEQIQQLHGALSQLAVLEKR